MSIFCLLSQKTKHIKTKKLEYEIVKLGFSWKAFLFSFIWGFAHKIWSFSIFFFFLFVILLYAESAYFLQQPILYIYILISHIYWGFFGNFILINHLTKNSQLEPRKLFSSSNYLNANLIYLSEK